MRYPAHIMAVLLCTAIAAFRVSASPLAPNLPGTWTNTFDEEFGASLDSGVWKSSLWSLPHPSIGQEVDSPSGISVSNGALSLSASASGQSYTGGLVNTGPASPGQPTGYSFLYGYAQASIKLVSGKGMWPAFWLLPDPNPTGSYHDDDGEIDVMEASGDAPAVDQIHFHEGSSNWGTDVNTGVDLTQGFHTYGVNWQPGKLDFYFDGNLVETINHAPSVPEYLIFDLAVGSSTVWPGAPDASTAFPSAMQVDSVQVWQSASVPEPSLVLAAMLALIPLTHRRCGRPRE